MTSIYLAGAETESMTRALLDNGCKQILYSFYFILTGRRESFVARMQDENPHVTWMLDSGAFSYGQQVRQGKDIMDWHGFKKRYFEYLACTWDKWGRIAELDLDLAGLIEPRAIEVWREQMFEMIPRANILPVWHGWRTTEWWTDYCKDKRIKVLGIGSDGSRDPGIARRLVMEAHRYGKPVHGFGMTDARTLQIVPYDTVDSTSWITGQKFGTIYTFRNGVFKAYAKRDLLSLGKAEITPNMQFKEHDSPEMLIMKQELQERVNRENARRDRLTNSYSDQKKEFDRRALRSYFKSIGCDPKLIFDDVKQARGKGDDPEYRSKCIAEVRKANIKAWVMLSNRYETLRKSQNRRMNEPEFGSEGVPTEGEPGPFE